MNIFVIYSPTKKLSQSMSITEIVNEFVSKISTEEKEMSLSELKNVLTECYNKLKKKGSKKSKKAEEKAEEKVEEKAEEKVEEEKPKKKTKKVEEEKKAKRAPSAYNNYVKQRIIELKKEQGETSAKELMQMAAAEWKNLSEEEKGSYK